jgi:predicted Fe-Mo cluster-binding NifX family protein
MVVAVPSEGAGGLDAPRSAHFGKAPSYTLVELVGGVVGDVSVIDNSGGHECGGPVRKLAAAGITAAVIAGIGGRPLEMLLAAGIDVYADRTSPRVSDAIAALLQGTLPRLEQPECGCGH